MGSIAPARRASPAAIGYYRRAARPSRSRETRLATVVKLGVPADQIQVAGRGERERLVATEDEVAEARNRRVEISVR